MDKYVVGQKEAKKTLAVGVYSHYRRLSNNEQQRSMNLVSLSNEAFHVYNNPNIINTNSSVDYISSSKCNSFKKNFFFNCY